MKKKTEQRFTSIALIVIGALVTALAICCWCLSPNPYFTSSRYTYYETYNGDAYTGIQNAAADISYNVLKLEETIEEIAQLSIDLLGFALIIVGAAFIYFGIIKLIAACGKEHKKVVVSTKTLSCDNEEYI